MLPFGKNSTPPNSPNRNHFDLSHQNNLTMDYGVLYPFHVMPVIPGDSAKIDVAFGIRALPTAFPVQTKLRIDAHYFYVRNRNLWDKWQSFIGKTGSDIYRLPYLHPDYRAKNFKTGSLGDYLGLPTTYVSNQSNTIPFDPRYNFEPSVISSSDTLIFGVTFPSSYVPTLVTEQDSTFAYTRIQSMASLNNVYQCFGFTGRGYGLNGIFAKGSNIVLHAECTSELIDKLVGLNTSTTSKLYFLPITLVEGNARVTQDVARCLSLGKFTRTGDGTFDVSFEVQTDFTGGVDFSLNGFCMIVVNNTTGAITNAFNPPTGYFDINPAANAVSSFTVERIFNNDVSESPLVRKLPEINVLPFRAYESIYNAFYRDQRNNPYYVNGVNDPNVYLPTTASGADPNDYSLRRRNWEQDFLTTAVPSPQQGVAPLVGITSTGVASFAMEDGTKYDVELTTADDGDTITGAKYTDNLPNSVARSLVNVATSGISISDFRNVNAYQRWLEINMRRGLKYKDQILSHFGVDPSYAELDMPEFIGGFTKWFDSSQVNQTAESEGSPLGSYAGQLSAVGGTEHTINHYCDEHGYIIGIVSIVPVPVYSQMLPKDFLKRDPLDYYFPEFGHISFQPITYNEVAPFQAAFNDVSGRDTYGYQRPWYDYLAATDEVHGDFRTTLKDFVIARTFESVPSLTPEFLTVNANQLNNVFTADSYIDDDGESVRISPFLGQIHIKCIMKRPIPLYGIPRLE